MANVDIISDFYIISLLDRAWELGLWELTNATSIKGLCAGLLPVLNGISRLKRVGLLRPNWFIIGREFSSQGFRLEVIQDSRLELLWAKTDAGVQISLKTGADWCWVITWVPALAAALWCKVSSRHSVNKRVSSILFLPFLEGILKLF